MQRLNGTTLRRDGYVHLQWGVGFQDQEIVTPSHRYLVTTEKFMKMVKENMGIVDEEERELMLLRKHCDTRNLW